MTTSTLADALIRRRVELTEAHKAELEAAAATRRAQASAAGITDPDLLLLAELEGIRASGRLRTVAAAMAAINRAERHARIAAPA
ncbi:hypothetical protein [Microbacterium laevaniformans]|uniref:hypothetical protein n=1 Tax=Microbacterium laevaniformans TaxID=36807 RepID=UPI003D96EA94